MQKCANSRGNVYTSGPTTCEARTDSKSIIVKDESPKPTADQIKAEIDEQAG
jgi:hypothetical protein